MPLSFLEEVYIKLHDDHRDTAETRFYFDTAGEYVEKAIGDRSEEFDLNDFHEIAVSYGRAECMTGFSRGIAFAFRLLFETMHPQEKTRAEIGREFDAVCAPFRKRKHEGRV